MKVPVTTKGHKLLTVMYEISGNEVELFECAEKMHRMIGSPVTVR
jgi:hypothetical protein